MSLTPGAGSMGYYGDQGSFASGSGSTGPAPGSGVGAGSPSAPAASPPATNLAPVNVNATASPGPPSSIDFGIGGVSAGGGLSADGRAPLHVTNLAPVNVKAQMPVQPGMFDSYMMWANDHPVLSKLAEGVVGNVTGLSPVLVAAHAYYNAKHGQPWFGTLLSKFGSAIGGIGSLGSGPGYPLSSNDNNPLFADLYNEPTTNPGMSAGDGGSGPIGGTPSITTSGALPYYPGLSALSGGLAPIGGFWNQQALRDAAPVYGPYAGFAQAAAPNPNPYGLPQAFAPAGIRGS
jgi:hypothetical protein